MKQDDWKSLIDFNASVLEQANKAIDHCVEFGVPYSSHVGPHLRHVIGHYEALLNGVRDVHIEYDVRVRNRVFERDPHAAHTRIGFLVAEIRSMAAFPSDRSVRVAFEGGLQGEFNFVAGSTLSRELLFLPHHAIHHFALVKSFLTDLGVPIAADFGLAPATIKHANGIAT